MFELLKKLYYKNFSNPHIIVLFISLIIFFIIIFFFNEILTPLLISIMLAFLLELPIQLFERLGFSRIFSISVILILFIGISAIAILIIVPTVWQQWVKFIKDLPNMINYSSEFIQNLLKKYPILVNIGIIDIIINNFCNRLSLIANSVFTASVSSLISIFYLCVYLVLVPLMTFFLLKDKEYIKNRCLKLLSKNRFLLKKVLIKMNQYIINYLRGRFIEIVFVGLLTYICFAYFKLSYAVLLSVFVSISVLFPYIGTIISIIPVVIVALFQYGITNEFWLLMIIYLIIQIIDSNIIIPLLFSNAVDLHPLIIILSIIIFGSLFGFCGVFFAIPLAALIKVVINVLYSEKLTEF
ncbi:AI-2E family transporter [Candidatus Providencia siddallii]|uniref:Permease PerM n=1 Tax=Candidatus Providencia siddallii TaxID=1715285 RepID=A0ABM9NNV3_9GAMM